MSAVLILRKRSQIVAGANTSLVAIIPVICGLLLAGQPVSLSIRASGIAMMWIGAFILFFGMQSFRRLLFPLMCLFLMVPIPERLVNAAVVILQQGSAEGVAILFSLTGTPYQREGLTFILPRTTIEIAPQCSSIRSSLALFISCLLAGHLILRTTSRKLILVLVAIPMAMVKNVIRIVTLSLLAIHVDMGYLAGSDLHRRGGIIFFVLTLLLIWPVLWVLRKTEKNATDSTD
jgi:exosortase